MLLFCLLRSTAKVVKFPASTAILNLFWMVTEQKLGNFYFYFPTKDIFCKACLSFFLVLNFPLWTSESSPQLVCYHWNIQTFKLSFCQIIQAFLSVLVQHSRSTVLITLPQYKNQPKFPLAYKCVEILY